MIEDTVLFENDDPTIEFDTSIHFFKNKMIYFKRQFDNSRKSNVKNPEPYSSLDLFVYDFNKNTEREVKDESDSLISKYETDEMRYYCRFSKEFGSQDVHVHVGDHSTDHICKKNFQDIMGKIYLSIIPYKLNDETIQRIKKGKQGSPQKDLQQRLEEDSQVHKFMKQCEVFKLNELHQPLFDIQHNLYDHTEIHPDDLTQPKTDIEFTCHKVEGNIIHFFICESKQIFHFEYNEKINQVKHSPQMVYNCKDKPPNRSWSTISIFSCRIAEKQEQFYFIDEHHQIQLLYPNTNEAHLRRQKILQIQQETGLQDYQHSKFKRIYCVNQHNDEACQGHNSIIYQSYEYLEKLICDKQGQVYRGNLKDDKITFFQDNYHQMLLVQKLLKNKKRLIVITMKQNEKFKNLKDLETCSESNHLKTFTDKQDQSSYTDKRPSQPNSIIECLHKKCRDCAKCSNTSSYESNEKQILYQSRRPTQSMQYVFQAQQISQKGTDGGGNVDDEIKTSLNQDNIVWIQQYNNCNDSDVRFQNPVMKRVRISNDKSDEKIIPLLYQRTMDGQAQFVFHLILNKQSLYIFVNKNYEEMCEIFEKDHMPIIKSNDKVKILNKSLKTYLNLKEESLVQKRTEKEKKEKNNQQDYSKQSDDEDDDELIAYQKKRAKQKIEIKFETITFEEIFFKYNRIDVRYSRENQFQETEDENQDENIQQYQIKLIFSQIQDESVDSNIIPFIYQEVQNTQSHTLFMFDIFQQKIVNETKITIKGFSQNMLYQDKKGFTKYKLCRSSDIEKMNIELDPLMINQVLKIQEQQWRMDEEDLLEDESITKRKRIKKIKRNYNTYTQRSKLILMRYFTDKFGQVSLSEFMIDHRFDETEVLHVSLKNVAFSKALIQHELFNYLEQSHLLPYYVKDKNGDCKCKIKGVQIVWFNNYSKKQAQPPLSSKRQDERQDSLEGHSLSNSVNPSIRVGLHLITPSEHEKKEANVQYSMDNTYFDLLDQEENNIYKYQTQIISFGYKKIIVSQLNNPQIYAMVVCVQLRKDLILSERLENIEMSDLLSKFIVKAQTMRIPDLKMLILGNYQQKKREEFFLKQEILYGKSICDINLNNIDEIQNALDHHNDNQHRKFHSIIESLSENDQIRNYVLRNISKSMNRHYFLQQDFNFDGAILRGLEMKGAYAGLKKLLDFIFQNQNNSAYQDIVMMYLPQISKIKKIDINQFFKVSACDDKLTTQHGFCNIEIPFKNLELPVFSDQKEQYMKVSQFSNQQYWREGIEQDIILKNIKTKNRKKIYEVEHSYCDFQQMILAQKIRKFKNNQENSEKFKKNIKKQNQPQDNTPKSTPKYAFDDYELSKMLSREIFDDNIDFYKAETVQKLISCQWEQTKFWWKVLFFIYLFLFMFPFCFSIIMDPNLSPNPVQYEGHNIFVHLEEDIEYQEDMEFWQSFCRWCINLCVVPQILLLIIELIQIKLDKLDYFQGWNFTDISHCVIFFIYYSLEDFNRHDGHEKVIKEYLPEIKLVLMLLSIIKLMQLIRLYDAFGLLVQMILMCVQELIPLITFTFMVLFIFLQIQIALNMTPNQTGLVSGAQGLNYHEQLFLSAFLTLQGNLQRQYIDEAKIRNYTVVARFFNVQFVSLFWFMDCFILVVLILNFLVCVIFNTYMRVKPIQKFMILKQHADLSKECFQIMKEFSLLIYCIGRDNFKVITFSHCKDQNFIEGDQYIEKIVCLKKQIKFENQELLFSQMKQIEKMNELQVIQKKMSGKIKKRFEKLLKDQSINNDKVRHLLENQINDDGRLGIYSKQSSLNNTRKILEKFK